MTASRRLTSVRHRAHADSTSRVPRRATSSSLVRGFTAFQVDGLRHPKVVPFATRA
jgi:hypothetical protein